MKAKLRCCASCEWIFHSISSPECPQCGFASYSARYVHGDKAYRYKISQKPWMKKKLDKERSKLQDIVNKNANEIFLTKNIKLTLSKYKD